MDERQESNVRGVVNDTIRFGCLIGSWAKSDVPWHRMAAHAAIEEITKLVIDEIKSILKKKDG